MAANTTFIEYFIGSSRRVYTANDFDVEKGEIVTWARERGISRIAVCKGVYKYRDSASRVQMRNVARNSEYTRKIEQSGLPIVYMPENVIVRIRNLVLRMNDGSERHILTEGSFGNEELRLIEKGLDRERLVVDFAPDAGGGTLTVAANYSASDLKISPEDIWAIPVNEPAAIIEAVSGEVWSDSPESLCLIAGISRGGKESVRRSAFNSIDGQWQKVEIPDVIRNPNDTQVEYVGICVRPLGWGYLVVGEGRARDE